VEDRHLRQHVGAGAESDEERRVAHHRQLVDGLHGAPDVGGGGEDALGGRQVTLLAQAHHRRPRGRDHPTGAAAGHPRRDVEPSRPVRRGEVLVPPQRLVPVGQHRGPLEGVAVLVGVRRDRGDARHPEVERGDRQPQPGPPGQDEATQASVDVHADATLGGQGGQVLDRVDEPVRVGAGRADEQDGPVGQVVAHPVDVHEVVRPHRRVQHLDAEVVPGLVQGDVRGPRHDHLRLGDAPLGARPLAVGVDSTDQALGAATGDHPARLLPGVVLGDGVRVEHAQRHRHDLALELVGAGVHVPLQDVRVCEGLEGLGQEVVVLVVPAVDRAGATAGVPQRVLFGGHGAQLVDDLGAVAAAGRQPVVDGETVPVGVEVVDDRGERAVSHGASGGRRGTPRARRRPRRTPRPGTT
jgi:hypothetical protein